MTEASTRRNKKTIKLLESQGFRKPYQILVDSTFVGAMNKLQDATAQIQHALRDFVKLFIPKCEYEKHRPSMKPRDASGQCEILRCSHDAEGAICLDGYIREGNKHHYILGTMDPGVIKKFRPFHRVPIMRIKNSQIIVETGEMQRIVKENRGAAASKKELRRLARLFGDDEEEDTIAE